jgi:hypothetical protein
MTHRKPVTVLSVDETAVLLTETAGELRKLADKLEYRGRHAKPEGSSIPPEEPGGGLSGNGSCRD